MIDKIKSMARLTIALAATALSVLAAPSAGTPGLDEKKIEEITKMVAPSVVRVEARNGMRRIATGVVIDKDGFILTTALVSPRDEEISVIGADGKRIKAEFKGLDTQTQICLIQAKDKGLVPITMGKSGDLTPGAWIGVVGLSPENTPAITQGIVSSMAKDSLRLNVWVVPGSSGSPVVNNEGQMVGLLRGAYAEDTPLVFEFRDKTTVASGYAFSRGEAPASGMAKATPIDVVDSIASELKKKGKIERGWLGVSVNEKMEIVEIVPKSPAELVKLKVGDIILKIDGKDIGTGQTVPSEIRSRKPGQDVTLRIERDGKPMDVKVKLGELTEDESKRELETLFPEFFTPRTLVPPAEPRSVKPGKAPQPPNLFVTPRPDRNRLLTVARRKYVGVSLQELSRAQSEFFGLKEGAGLWVTEFAEDSPAKKAGLKIGDVIVRAEGKRVETVDELSRLIQDKKKGDKIRVEFLRDKKPMTLDIEIGEEETGPLNLLRDTDESLKLLQEQMKKSNEIYQNQVQEFDNKSEEGMRKLYEEATKQLRNQTEKGSSLSKQFQKILKYPGAIYRI